MFHFFDRSKYKNELFLVKNVSCSAASIVADSSPHSSDKRVFIYSYNLPTSTDLDLDTGIFTAPTSKKYMVTVTAMISGKGNHEHSALSSYAQIFLLKNGKLNSLENYLLVEQDKVADLKVNMALTQGDTLSLYVGHHITHLSYSGPSGGEFTVMGFNLEQVRFCIF